MKIFLIKFQGCPLQGFDIGRNLQENFLCNIIGKRHQEIYLKLEDKFGRKYPGSKVGR